MTRRVVFRRFGEVDVLEVEETIVRKPGPGELRIATAFAGVNYADVIARRGFYKWAPPFPTCVGFELSGTVVEVGEGVTSHTVGDRVAAVTRFGGYADEIVVEAARAWKVPDGMRLEDAAAIPAVYITAWQSLMEVARIRAGDTVLIQAVAGGVGLAALQLAKKVGLRTYGTASSEEKLELARAHGLDHGIDYVRLDFEQEITRLTNGRGVDFVLDSLGGTGLRKGYRCLARGGLVVTIGAAGVAPPSRDPVSFLRAGVELVKGGVYHPFQLIEDNRGIAGVQVLLLWDDLPRLDRAMARIFEWWREGAIKPHVDRIVPLADARDAHRALESRKTRGKLLLACAGAAGGAG
ncbi:MAG: zinc-binding dehydrogenase [Deltaproteobacteria bacterium]|nr:zinc-binding dehydrogenase [Deltaproteobacteria bacterium]